MSSPRPRLLVLMLLTVPMQFCWGDVKLPAVIGNHMVLQQDQPIPVWGWAAPGEGVTVGFAGTTADTIADRTGRWQVWLPQLTATARPRSMDIQGSNGSSIQLTDILIGEVWLCTGPSNIYWPVRRCDNAEQEVRQAAFPRIRFFTVEREAADEPQDDCVGHWFGCRPQTIGDVSGIGYFFSRRLHQDLDVPIGLLQSFWGGSRIEAWTSRAALESEPGLEPIREWWQEEFHRFDPVAARRQHEQQLAAWRKSVARAKAAGSQPPRRPAAPVDPRMSPHRPASLYNGMIAPLIPFSIRGVICYQGLGNLFWANHSTVLLETMIHDWRSRWALGDIPVGMVQPAPYDCGSWLKSGPDAYSLQREAQLKVLERVANTGIAPTLDVDAVDELHFSNKQLVGRRLACWALATVYGFDLPYAGPVYDSMTIDGDAARIHFRHAGAGLTTSDGQPPAHFEIAGPDRKYYPAQARIDGPTVVVRSRFVAQPAAVRFAFTDVAVVNLINPAGLPASLFRTGVVPLPTSQER